MKVRFRRLRKLDDFYYCECPGTFCEINHTGDYYPATDYEALQAKLDRLVEAAERAYTALEIASSMLTEEMKCALKGKRWAGKDIDKLKAAIEAGKG